MLLKKTKLKTKELLNIHNMNTKTWRLADKKAVITGGTKGIGFSTATEFLSLGAAVIIVARNEEDVNTVVSNWNKEGFEAYGIAADTSTIEGRNKLFKSVKEKWQAVDVLVNNVGTNIRKQFNDYSSEEYQHIFNVNIFSTMEVTKMFFPLIQNSGNASIINVASIAGMLDAETGIPYGITKAAEIQLTKGLANEWAKHGIRVNTVSPWFTRTPLTAPLFDNPELMEKVLRRTPLNRVAGPEEMADVIAFLAMDKSSYITGQNIAVDGGMTVKAF
jgi:tropinone reductase I